MAHYDFMYEEFSLRETEEEIERTNCVYQRLKKRKQALQEDFVFLTNDYSKELLNEKINDLNRDIERYKRQLHNWKKIKADIQNGKTYSWEQAKNTADSFNYL